MFKLKKIKVAVLFKPNMVCVLCLYVNIYTQEKQDKRNRRGKASKYVSFLKIWGKISSAFSQCIFA